MRTLISALLLFAAAPACADWVKVVEAADSSYYVDPTSASYRPAASMSYGLNIGRVYVMQEYAKPDASGVRSRVVLYEIDCNGNGLRSLSETNYSEPMAQGKPVDSWESTSPWLYLTPITGSNIPPRTPYRPIVKFVCSG